VDKFLTELANWKHGRILKINKYTLLKSLFTKTSTKYNKNINNMFILHTKKKIWFITCRFYVALTTFQKGYNP